MFPLQISHFMLTSITDFERLSPWNNWAFFPYLLPLVSCHFCSLYYSLSTIYYPLPMSFLKRHSFIMGLAIVLILVGAVMAGNVARRAQKAEVTPQVIPHVTLVSVAEYAKDKSIVSADGSVESLEQAVLRSQVNAPVARVLVAIGGQVRRDQLLVTLQNSDISAQLAQAAAGLKAQQAHLAEIQKGARPDIQFG